MEEKRWRWRKSWRFNRACDKIKISDTTHVYVHDTHIRVFIVLSHFELIKSETNVKNHRFSPCFSFFSRSSSSSWKTNSHSLWKAYQLPWEHHFFSPTLNIDKPPSFQGQNVSEKPLFVIEFFTTLTHNQKKGGKLKAQFRFFFHSHSFSYFIFSFHNNKKKGKKMIVKNVLII